MERPSALAFFAGFPLVVAVCSIPACGQSTSPSTCVPGATQRCVCPTGSDGVQACNAAGTFDPCACLALDGGAEPDAGMPVDAGLDATIGTDTGTPDDAAVLSDGGWDAGADGGSTADAGLGCPSGVLVGGRCLFSDCLQARRAGYASSGIYLIDPDGLGSRTPTDAYCDMVTDGGGWTLVYRIRDDIPDIADPWWGMVGVGSGSAFPTSPSPLPEGTHFDGPTRDVRAALSAQSGVLGRATLLEADGSIVLDVAKTRSDSQPISFVIQGVPGNPSTGGSPGPGVLMSLTVLASVSAPPAVGATGYEEYIHASSGNDGDYFYIPSAGSDSVFIPITGDQSAGGSGPTARTTLFWLRASAP